MKKILIALCLFSITACRAGTVEERDLPAARREGFASSTVPLAITSAKLQTKNDFAFRLYEQLSKQDGNLFFSPASIEAALSMTAEGAAGNTKVQLDALLPSRCDFPNIGNSVTFENANAIWVDQKFPMLGKFQQAVREKHQAELREADFVGQPDRERLKINGWVEEKTREKIKDLLPAGSVHSMTRLLLVNAIYFKGDWLHAFDPKKTEEMPFHPPSPKGSGETGTLENGSVDVPMMRLNKTRFAYGENEFFQTLELPYKGKELSMVIFLPRKKIKISDIQSMLTEAAAAPLRKTEVNVTLPRFKVESTFASLKKDLVALGLTDAFDARLANFSGISPNQLFISDVVHKAFVDVNEEGTEAAAATGIVMRLTSIEPPPKTFRADRPFLFLIRENSSGKILFMGRICDPSK